MTPVKKIPSSTSGGISPTAKKVYWTVVATLSSAVIMGAAKAYVDVAQLKTRMDIYVDTTKEMKEDIKEIKRDIKSLLKEE